MKLLITILAVTLIVFPVVSQEWKVRLDKPAAEWADNKVWINSTPLTLKDLKGKVVLIRWWLDTCPYCKASAPTLNEFQKNYSDKGLVIIGMYHPKPIRKMDKEKVEAFAEAKGFTFPIAIDDDWEALNKYWMDGPHTGFTSISYLLDRNGVIRYIHPGGSYNKDALPFDNKQWQSDYYDIKAKIESLLSE